MSVDSKAPVITVRRATLSDRQDVLDLGKGAHLFDGMDYLPAFYTRLLQDKQFRGYIAFVDGDPASFTAFYVDPEEKFFISMGSRTKACYLGRNIFQLTFLNGLQDTSQDIPEGNYDCLGAAVEKPDIHKNAFWESQNRQIVRRKAYLKYKVTGSTIKKMAEQGAKDPQVEAIRITQLNNDEALQIFQDKYTQKYILKDEYIPAYSNTMPFPKTLKYMKYLVTQSVCFASFKSDNTTPRGVSFATLNTAQCGVIFTLYIYTFEHPDVVLGHIINHLTVAAKAVEDDVIVGIRILFPCDIDKEIVKEFLYPVFGKTAISKEHPIECLFINKRGMPLSKL